MEAEDGRIAERGRRGWRFEAKLPFLFCAAGIHPGVARRGLNRERGARVLCTMFELFFKSSKKRGEREGGGGRTTALLDNLHPTHWCRNRCAGERPACVFFETRTNVLEDSEKMVWEMDDPPRDPFPPPQQFKW